MERRDSTSNRTGEENMYIESVEFHHSTFDTGEPLQRALNGQTMTLDPRVNIIVGPNASGKSSIVRMIARLSSAGHEPGPDSNPKRYGTVDEDLHMACITTMSPDWPAHGRGGTIQDAAPVLCIP